MQAVTAFRSSAAHQTFTGRWKLSFYFTLCFQVLPQFLRLSLACAVHPCFLACVGLSVVPDWADDDLRWVGTTATLQPSWSCEAHHASSAGGAAVGERPLGQVLSHRHLRQGHSDSRARTGGMDSTKTALAGASC